jgi:hypothetical protein
MLCLRIKKNLTLHGVLHMKQCDVNVSVYQNLTEHLTHHKTVSNYSANSLTMVDVYPVRNGNGYWRAICTLSLRHTIPIT